jgi:hypothetical protein
MTAQARARHRAPAARLGRWLAPVSVAVFAWLADNDPLGLGGLGLLLGTAALAGVFYPVLVVLALQAPGALVPPSWRRWHRRGEHERPHIPLWLRRVVYAADRYACVACRQSGDLQLDHVRPWTAGGRTSLWNLMTLCGSCNKLKSNYWVYRDGYVLYTPWRGRGNASAARAILAREMRNRHSIMRLVRASLSL